MAIAGRVGWLLAGLAAGLYGQSTQGLLAGRVTSAANGAPVSGAVVTYRAANSSASASTTASDAGRYTLPSLTPDTYQLRVAAPGFQPQEVFGLELNVAGRLEADFRLRPLADVFGERQGLNVGETGLIVRFFGPDVDLGRNQLVAALRTGRGAMESSVSEVIHAREIRDLPLAGRDVYTMLVTQAGVTADSTTARGLGLSVNGQRPSSSNFLLDGVENNNYLITGPLTVIAPEAVQEYRFTSNNFSAEFGGTAGFIANAATRAGSPAWHGTGYFYGKHSTFNANTFRRNLLGVAKPRSRETQPGYQVGGPILRNRLFISSALEVFRSRGFAEPVDVLLPTPVLAEFTRPGGPTRRLLEAYPAPLPAGQNPLGALTATARFQPPTTVNRTLALQRADWVSRGGTQRVVGRVSVQRLGRPDFIWTPYTEFSSGLRQNTASVMVGLNSNVSPNLTSEARAAFSDDTLEWDRAHPEIPTLISSDGAALPGSPAFYAYRNRTRSWEFRETVTWIRGSHILKFGGSALPRSLSGWQTAGRDGLYGFNSVIDWAFEEPLFFSAPVDRAAAPRYRLPDSARRYRQTQFAGFVQDTWRVATRFVLNLGLRYESYGAPKNTGEVKDFSIALGTGSSFPARLAGASFHAPGDGAPVYPADRNDWAGRFGFSYSTAARGPLVRGAYGIFHDRLFDNAWQNVRSNNFQLALFQLPIASRDYLEPVSTTLTKLEGSLFASGFPAPTLLQPGLRTAYAHSYFLGVQQRLGERWSLEANGTGSAGRKLITTDIVNRQVRLTTAPRTISYRGNQGLSNYNALTASARYQASRGLLHAAYTWSHSIDLQSEPLAGDFFDLSFARVTSATRNSGIAAFSREFDASGDRGNSDFDQRHNLVLYSVWDLPGRSLPLRNWKVAQMAAFRTGFPFSVFGPSLVGPNGEFLLNARADRIGAFGGILDVPGGRQWLDPAAFRLPAPGVQGNTGRNAFRGPGLYNVDLSVSRSFSLPKLGESARLIIRADAFNFLNHANLNNPVALIGSPDFGVASFGRTGRDSGFPATVPFAETARQFQFLLRVSF